MVPDQARPDADAITKPLIDTVGEVIRGFDFKAHEHHTACGDNALQPCWPVELAVEVADVISAWQVQP